MKKLLVFMLLAVLPAWAAPPCTDCGVVRSVRAISKEQREVSPVQETKPSGLVISIPAGGMNFPIVWSIIGAALFVALINLITRRRTLV